jgi:hypothetical protein
MPPRGSLEGGALWHVGAPWHFYMIKLINFLFFDEGMKFLNGHIIFDREGKPIGCAFVIGDITKIKSCRESLVLNLFYDSKEDRNILNPFMAETMNESASINDAFIVRAIALWNLPVL